jgi:hypothetical protein
MDILQFADDTKARLGEKSKTYLALKAAIEEYLDLRLAFIDGRPIVCSAIINPYVDQADITRGDELHVRPFVVDCGQAIYSEPPSFAFGTRSTDFGVTPIPGWDEEMRYRGINDDLIKKVKDFLAANTPYGVV